MLTQTKATELTTVVENPVQDGEYLVQVLLGSFARIHTVGRFPNRDEAENAEVAINQVMIEYRLKRNEWERSVTEKA